MKKNEKKTTTVPTSPTILKSSVEFNDVEFVKKDRLYNPGKDEAEMVDAGVLKFKKIRIEMETTDEVSKHTADLLLNFLAKYGF